MAIVWKRASAGGAPAPRRPAARTAEAVMGNIVPWHLMRWIEEHQGHFSGPVANKEVFPESEFIYQIVRGPNARNDFHIDPGDEIFCQLKGDITVRCIDADGTMH